MQSIKYGINTADCNVFLNSSEIVLLAEGNLVKISSISVYDGKYVTRIYSNDAGELRQSEIDYHCNVKDFVIVDYELWMILIAVKNVDRRLKIARLKTFQRFLLKLQVGSKCHVNGNSINKTGAVKCQVRYVGLVPEKGPGFFFGFVTQDPLDYVSSKTPLAAKYFTCSSTNGFIRAADALLFENGLSFETVQNPPRSQSNTARTNNSRGHNPTPVANLSSRNGNSNSGLASANRNARPRSRANHGNRRREQPAGQNNGDDCCIIL